MQKVSLYSICLIFLLAGCKEDNNDSVSYKQNGILISIDKTENTVDSSKQFIENIEITPLKFKDSTLLSGIDKILVYKNQYYLMDKKFSAIYRFDNNGTFLNKIGHLGVAPGEYRGLNDFIIDSTDRVIALSNNDQALFYYTPEGNFLKKNKLNIFASQIAQLDPNSYLFYVNYNYNNKCKQKNFLVMDSSGNIKETMMGFDRKKENMSIAFSGFLSRTGSGILLSNAFNDTIFSYTNEFQVQPEYIVDFGKSSFKDIRKDFSKAVKKKNLISGSYSWIERSILNNEKYMIFPYVHATQLSYCFFNKQTKQYYTSNKNINEGLLKLLNMPLQFKKDDEIIYAVSPESVIQLKEDTKMYHSIQTNWPAFYAFLDKLTLNDNYFLITCKLIR